MTRDEMIAALVAARDAIDYHSGGAFDNIDAVLDALRADAPSPEMPVLAAGDWLDIEGIGMALVPYAAGLASLQGSASVIAVYRATWRREVPRG